MLTYGLLQAGIRKCHLFTIYLLTIYLFSFGLSPSKYLEMQPNVLVITITRDWHGVKTIPMCCISRANGIWFSIISYQTSEKK